MNRTALNLATLSVGVMLLGAAPARAGLYLEEEQTIAMTGQSNTATIKTWIEGDMVRTDDPRTGGVILINTKTSTVTGVHPNQKTWWRLKDEDVASFGQQTLMAYGIVRGQDGKLQVPAEIFVKTGKRQKIGEWDAYEVKINMEAMSKAAPQLKGQLQNSLWFAEVKGYDPGVARKRLRMWMGDGPEAEAFMKQWDQLEGVQILSEMTSPSPQGGTITIKQGLKRVGTQKVGADSLLVPKGFKQVDDPFTEMKRMMQQNKGVGGNAPPPMQ